MGGSFRLQEKKRSVSSPHVKCLPCLVCVGLYVLCARQAPLIITRFSNRRARKLQQSPRYISRMLLDFLCHFTRAYFGPTEMMRRQQQQHRVCMRFFFLSPLAWLVWCYFTLISRKKHVNAAYTSFNNNTSLLTVNVDACALCKTTLMPHTELTRYPHHK